LNNVRPVLISVGSNLGDRRAAIAFAVDRLSQIVSNLRLSNIIETEPVGEGMEGQPRFLNAAIAGTTTMDARTLLDALLAIEGGLGRQRPHPNAARTLDLDLILFGDEIIDEGDLQVPHPRFRDRRFVLEPAADVAAHYRDPVTGRTIRDLLAALR